MSGKNDSSPRLTKESLLVTHTDTDMEQMRNIVGPIYICAGLMGAGLGLVSSFNTNFSQRRPTKLIVSSALNSIGKSSNKYANAAAGLAVIYSINRSCTQYLFKEELEYLNEKQKAGFYGFSAGLIFKSTRGLAPALFAGTLFGGATYGFKWLREKGYTKYSI